LIETTETLLRPWNIDGPSVRPAHRMVAHTAFLTTARRIDLVSMDVPWNLRLEPSAGGITTSADDAGQEDDDGGQND
jgi:tRNA (adenine57-N1/adenine58-N1)-methyltransferase